jgi:hypothetical protein
VARRLRTGELERRLLRRMTQESDAGNGYSVGKIAARVREHAAALSFMRGQSIANLTADPDFGAGWNHERMEQAFRNRARSKTANPYQP